MSILTMPKIIVDFITAARETANRAQRGTVAMIVRDAVLLGDFYTLKSAADIPATLSAENKAYITRAFTGGAYTPYRVLLTVMDSADSPTVTLSDALAELALHRFDFLCGPADCTSSEASSIKTWIETQRSDYHRGVQAVLPATAADSVGVINFDAAGMTDGTTTFTAAAFCSRIAGLIAGTPLTRSATYVPLPELTDVTRLTDAEMDTAVGAGKLILWHDGRKVKLGRAVNSLQTLGSDYTDDWKKIKIVSTLDMAQDDLRVLFSDVYVGKVANTYANKQLLVVAVQSYLAALVDAGLLASGTEADIDVEAQAAYLRTKGVDTSVLTDQQIREYDTDTHVFLAASVRPMDAMEDIKLKLYC